MPSLTPHYSLLSRLEILSSQATTGCAKRGRDSFAGTALRVLRLKESFPLFAQRPGEIGRSVGPQLIYAWARAGVHIDPMPSHL